ncbi:hypothetical protein FRC08_007368, partial [Ceratobasidium sp. 394]
MIATNLEATETLENSNPLPATNSQAANFHPAQREWEEAGDNLFTAIPGYLGALSRLNDIPASLDSSADLVSRILQHSAHLDVLANSRALLGRLLNKHNPLINKIPVEILIHIFHISIDQAQPILLGHNDDLPNIYQRTTTLVSVCYWWRRVALDSPTLWSLVPLIGRDYERENPLVGLWLERGGDVPLHIILCQQRNESITIAPMLSAHARRFRTLNIVADSWEAISAMLACWLDHGIPGSLTELSTAMRGGHLPLLS